MMTDDKVVVREGGEPELRRLQREQQAWSDTNFGRQPAHFSLLGMQEELGEISHAFLKMEQGIRGTAEEHMTELRDGVGDLVIYLCGFCNDTGIDLEEAVRMTWDVVRQRDWRRSPRTG